MKLTVVGCAPAWTRRPGRASSCYLVEESGRAIVLDFGQGAFSEVSRYIDPGQIDGLLVSHLHPDHFVDLVPLRHYLKYEAKAPIGLELHGPPGLSARLDGLFAERGFLGSMSVHALVPGSFEVAGLRIEAARVTHIPDSFAFRVATGEGPGLMYSGDCGVADDLLPLLRPGDTLLCEAAFGVREPVTPIHLNAAAAAGIAERSGAARLILTHVEDRSEAVAARDEAARIFSGEVRLAEPGLTVSI